MSRRPITSRRWCTALTSPWSTVSSPTAAAWSPIGKDSEGWFDVSTLKEPFRVEGKKTMGYELVEQLGWEYPDAVFYPTGGGVGLIGMWKAFAELEELGWVRPGKRPRMIAVQAAGCAPVVRAFERGDTVTEMWQNAATCAAGLRVPKPYGDSIMLEILRDSNGLAVAVSDDDLLASMADWGRSEGIFLCPEGAAATAAYDRLLAAGVLTAEDRVVIFNTGGGLKYTDVTAEAMGLGPKGELVSTSYEPSSEVLRASGC